MSLPYRFIAGHVAKSSEVNANFNHLMDLIGQLTTPERAQPLGEFMLGPRRTVLISANTDTGDNATAFMQITWNADYNRKGAAWVYERVVPSNPATSLRIGRFGLQVLSTSLTSGNLNTQLKKVFAIVPEGDLKGYVYLPNGYSIKHKEGTSYLSDYRLTMVLYEEPRAIYRWKAIPKTVRVFNAYDYAVPKEAKAVIIRTHITADNHSGAGMLFYQEQNKRDWFKGFVTHATITGHGLGMRAGGWGVVPLGTGAHAGKFVMECTSSFYVADVHVMGYMV